MKALYKLFAFVAIAFYLFAPTTIVFAATTPTCKLMLSTSSITAGSSATLSWTSANATSGAIVGVGNVGASGSTTVHPSKTTTYAGSFTSTAGTANCSITLKVTSTATGGTSYGTQSTSQDGTSYGVQNATIGSSNSSASTQTSSGSSGSNTSSSNSSFLVPCGYGSFSNSQYALDTKNDQGSTGCQACSLAQLVQNIINFIIGLSIPVAAALFAWAGVLYFTSAENISQRQKAKDIFKNAFIGFIIIITAWLVINTLLNVIFNQSSVFKGGNWFQIQCSASRPIKGEIGGILSSALGTAQVVVSGTNTAGNANNSAYSCASGYALTNTDGLVSCVMTDSNGNYVDSQAPTCTNNANPNIDGQCPDANGNIVLPTTGGSATGTSGSSVTCTSDAASCISSYNTSNGSNQLVSQSGVNWNGVSPALTQSILSDVENANAGTVTVTSAERNTLTTSGNVSLHDTGNAVDIGSNNTQFDSYISQNWTSVSNVIDPSLSAYKDPNGYIWSQESNSTAGSSGAHWHVSTTGH